MRNEISKLLQFKSQNTYYKWKKEERPIIKLLEKYFTYDNLKEFLNLGTITKFERLNAANKLEIELENLYSENFMLNFELNLFVIDFIDHMQNKLTLENVRDELYKYIYNNILAITEEIQEDEWYRENPDDIVDEDYVLVALINTFNKFSDRELKFFLITQYHYNPFRDNKNPKL